MAHSFYVQLRYLWMKSVQERFNISHVIVAHNEQNMTMVQQMRNEGWLLESDLWQMMKMAREEEPRNIIIPVHIQCLMGEADQFIGNLYSSFSMRIRVLRKVQGRNSLSFR